MKGRKRTGSDINRAKIKALLKRHDMTVEDLAEGTGYVEGTIWQALRMGYMSGDMLRAVADMLYVNVEELKADVD